MPELNFIIGSGERLTEGLAPPRRNPRTKDLPYSPSEARARLFPEIQNIANEIENLSPLACPGDQAVALMTLHPQWIAKSYFPVELLADSQFRAIGSRNVVVRPESWTRAGEPQPSVTTEIFVAGPRRSFFSWPSRVLDTSESSRVLTQLSQVELLAYPDPLSKVSLDEDDQSADSVHLEVVLHAGAADEIVLPAFSRWSRDFDAQVDFDRRLNAGGLTFIPVFAPRTAVRDLAQFSFLRVVRSIPRLRTLRPAVIRSRTNERISLPIEGPIDSEIRVAVFDGGVEPSSALAPWVREYDTTGVGSPEEDSLDHGYEVTGALLFGPLGGVEKVPIPYASVDHYRVLDDERDDDPAELYDILERIRDVLSSQDYEFVNLSIGPEIPIEDNDAHSWTVTLDEILASGDTLLTVAAGNWGEYDRASGNARVQPPADAVNALSVGAASSLGDAWDRAPYSCVGPGRSPGLIKPDVLAFGGSSVEPFNVLRRDRPGRLLGVDGTSYAAPLALRTALGARTLLGPRMTPLSLRALLIHAATDGGLDREDVGWGRVPIQLEDLVVCPPGSARILYQGWLDPGKYLRAQVPLPPRLLDGFVTLSATIAYAAPIDPAHASSYTRAGLEVVFRPHSGKIKVEKGATVAATSQFFQRSQYTEEDELRSDAHKWETVMHRSKRMRGSSLQAPVFDIHYNARDSGHDATSAPRIRYAAIISIVAPHEPNLYNEIMTTYAGTLEALVPVAEVPIRVTI